jgi:uncharacterized membrane protein
LGQLIVSRQFAATVHQAETAWYDASAWPLWVDGLEQVDEVRQPWPAPGGSVRWHSGPAGRGEVVEEVVAQEPLRGQTVRVVDPQMEAEQRVAFTPQDEDHVTVTLTLDYRLLRRNPLTPVLDRLFIRPVLRGSVESTLSRFGHQLEASAAHGRH